LTTFLDLSWPFLAAVVLLAVAVAFGPTDVIELVVPIGITHVVVQGSNLLVAKVALLLGAITALAIPAFRDYSRLFPLDLRFKVSFDRQGLEESLGRLDKRDRPEVGPNWHEQREDLLGKWNKLMRDYKLPAHVRFTETTAGDGFVTFRLANAKGWQTYQIAASQGQLRLTFEHDGQPTQLHSDFELLSGSSTRIESSLAEIYLHWTKVIRPRFTQYVQVAPLQRVAITELTAVTKLRFFPAVRVGRTVYFADDPSSPGRRYVPIAYAIYET